MAEVTDNWFLPSLVDNEKKLLAKITKHSEIAVDVFNDFIILASTISATYFIHKSFSAICGKGAVTSENNYEVSPSSKALTTNTSNLTLSENDGSHHSAENHPNRTNLNLFKAKFNSSLRYYSDGHICVDENSLSNKDNSQHNSAAILEEII